jgi:hypothetical protein
MRGSASHAARAGSSGSKPTSASARRQFLAPSHQCCPCRPGVDAREVEAQRAPTSRSGAARPVADHGGVSAARSRPYLRVDVLDDLLAPLVLEIDVDVGRLVALAR